AQVGFAQQNLQPVRSQPVLCRQVRGHDVTGGLCLEFRQARQAEGVDATAARQLRSLRLGQFGTGGDGGIRTGPVRVVDGHRAQIAVRVECGHHVAETQSRCVHACDEHLATIAVVQRPADHAVLAACLVAFDDRDQ
ncbi:hypothetical protein K7G98_31940, partial [Saccharothrix sp. MB29]|nr:hypothetical protein [Saccharothrix sp. MB29]